MPITKITVNGRRGDNAGFSLTATRGGQPADFTDTVVRSELRSAPDDQLLGEWGVVVEGSRLTFHLLPKETEQLPAQAKFDVEVDWSGGQRTSVQTIAIGVLNTPLDITLPPAVT
jgi:hypothetical protein